MLPFPPLSDGSRQRCTSSPSQQKAEEPSSYVMYYHHVHHYFQHPYHQDHKDVCFKNGESKDCEMNPHWIPLQARWQFSNIFARKIFCNLIELFYKKVAIEICIRTKSTIYLQKIIQNKKLKNQHLCVYNFRAK